MFESIQRHVDNERGNNAGTGTRTQTSSVQSRLNGTLSKSSRSRATIQRSRPLAWHLGQCRFLHELYEAA